MTTPKHVSGTIKAEHMETLRKMADQLIKNAENAERMCELLQPEFDKFEARAEPHNVYVVRDYVDHRIAAKRQRKEAAAILAAIQPDLATEAETSALAEIVKKAEAEGMRKAAAICDDKAREWSDYSATEALSEGAEECRDAIQSERCTRLDPSKETGTFLTARLDQIKGAE